MNDTSRWDAIVQELKLQMDAMHTTREAALPQCRRLVQLSSRCIRCIHRREFAEAEDLLAQARLKAQEARSSLASHPKLLYAGYLQDAEKEMVEAALVFEIVRGGTFPRPCDLGVDATSYLNGAGEAASECRRYVLDEMRRGNLAEAERMLLAMEAIYDDLIAFDYADSLTGGLRRTCDSLRAVIERTRSDLTMTHVQQGLMRELQRRV